MNKAIFGRPIAGSNGSLIRLCLTVQCQHPTKHYAPYAYFGVHTSHRAADVAAYRLHSVNSCHEWLMRDRRAIAFTDASGLAPQKLVARRYDKFIDRVIAVVRCDHYSFWKSDRGTLFMLNEPYGDLDPTLSSLVTAGFAYIEIPEELSPYCGRWSPNPGVRPGTTSYLICAIDDRAELVGILSALKIAASVSPAWNDVDGVHHV